MYKLTIVMRSDLKMSKGKACAQAAHAAVECVARQDDDRLKKKWLDEGGKKIVLKVQSLEALHTLNHAAKRAGLITSVIQDAGHTELEPGTVTCLGIGPDTEERIDKVTKDLKPY